MPTDELSAIVDKMIAAGESDDDIQFVIDDYRSKDRLRSASPETQRAERAKNMAAQAPVLDKAQADSGLSAGLAEAKDRAWRYLGGVAQGAASVLDPRSYIDPALAASNVLSPSAAGHAATQRLAAGVKDTGNALLHGSPEAWGGLLGTLATGEAVPRVVPKVPNALVRVGEGLEDAASSPLVKKIVHPTAAAVAGATGWGGGVAEGLAAGALTEAVPPVVEAAGRGLARVGRKMGATAGRNAGGVLLGAPQTMEEMLNEARGLQPEPVRPESVELPPEQRMTATGRPGVSNLDNHFTTEMWRPDVNAIGRTVGEPDSYYAPSNSGIDPTRSRNAGGTLVPGSGEPPPSLADYLMQVTRPEPAALPESVELPPMQPPATDPALNIRGRSMEFAPPTQPDITPNPNAGGVLKSNSGGPQTLEDYLHQALSTRQAPASVELTPQGPPPTDPALNVAGRSMEFSTPEPATAEPPVADTPATPDDLSSPIAQQLLASLQAQAAPPSTPKVPVTDIIPSKSRSSAPSATPGLTIADVESVGLNPAVRITQLTQDLLDRILQNRAARHASRYTDAVSEAAAKRSVARGKE